jgi:hypothetical protein
VAGLVERVRVIVGGDLCSAAVTAVPTSRRTSPRATLGRKRGAMADLTLILILFVATAGTLIIPAVRGMHRRQSTAHLGVVGPPAGP